MPYWQNVTRSFVIVWRHKYLWLLALFAGEGGGGTSFSYNQGNRSTYSTTTPTAVVQQVTNWLGQHLGLIVVAAIAGFVLLIALFILAAVCEGALIRGSAEHDADRPFDLGRAWSTGIHTMWLIVRFRLLLVALGLPAVLIVAGVVAGGVIAAFSHNVGAAVALILLGVLLALGLFVYLIYLGFLDRFGARNAILHEQGAVASLRGANRLLFSRLGRSLLVWLLSIAVSIALGIAAVLVYLIAAVPLIIGLAGSAGPGSPAWPLIIVGVIVLLVIALPVTAFTGAQASTYWTLSFRRMDIDYPPAYAPIAPPS